VDKEHPTNTWSYFGWAVSLHDEVLVVGAHESPGNGYVYIYLPDQAVPGTWLLHQFLYQSPTVRFGRSLDMYGDTIVITAFQDAELGFKAGAAFVYEKSDAHWVRTAKLTASNGAAGMHFGNAVAIHGDTIAISSTHVNGNTGAIYVFERAPRGVAWVETAILTAAGATIGDNVGTSIALEGDTLAIGAWGDDVDGSNSGAVYVFERSAGTWSQTQKLEPAAGKKDDYFGRALGLEGDTLVVGAHVSDYQAEHSGSAWVYQREPMTGLWTEEQRLGASNGGKDDYFGFDVAIDEGVVAVGAWAGDGAVPDSGAAYVFERSPGGAGDWVETALIAPADGELDDRFGIAVALEEGVLAAGSYQDHTGYSNTGSAYVFRSASGPSESYCTAGTSSAGCHAVLNACGTPSATAATGFVLSVAGVEQGASGLFFHGLHGRQAIPWRGSGYQCVRPPLYRGVAQTLTGASGACDLVHSEDLNARWCPTCPQNSGNPGPGQLVQAQFWYRLPMSTSGTTSFFSSAVEVTVEP
jgi:hypothetical protein